MLGSGRVEFFAGCEYLGDRTFVSRVSGERFEVPRAMPDRRRALPRPRHPGRDAAAVRRRRRRAGDPGQRPRARSRRRRASTSSSGSGKTATDACIWLLARGVDPDAICWVRPRDPWMLNRALIQPDPVDLPRHGRRHDAGGRGGGIAAGPVPPAGGRRDHAAHRPLGHADDGQGAHPRRRGSSSCCAASRTSCASGHIVTARRGRLDFADGSVAIADDALIVNCAADGLKMPPLVPIWGPDGDHAATDPGRLPVLRGGAGRVRRGDPRRRRARRTGSARRRPSATP